MKLRSSRETARTFAIYATFFVCAWAGKADVAKTADFNGDGYADLAIGAPGQDTGIKSGGAVHLLYGSSSGPFANGHTVSRLTGYFPGYFGSAGDRFGEVLATADFDGDGFADLAVTAPGAQSVFICYGSRVGLGLRTQQWTADNLFSKVSGAGILGFGDALATGDFNNDAFADLVIGAPDATVDGQTQRVFEKVGSAAANVK